MDENLAEQASDGEPVDERHSANYGGYPQGTLPDGSGRRVFNVGILSEWHQRGTDMSSFLCLLRPGDLIEFKREGYCHWGVYIGDHALTEGQEDDGFVQVLPCLVHRANPTDGDNADRLFSGSQSLAKGIHGIGDVVVEPLWDVWNHSQARINNSMDNAVAPYPSEEVVARALQVVHGEDSLAYTPYNVVTNNCEHFASWCRNSWAISTQVSRGLKTLLNYGLTAAAVVVLPRPVSFIGGLALAGLQMMEEVRRT